MIRQERMMKKGAGSAFYMTLASAVVLSAMVVGLSHWFLQFRRSSRLQIDAQRAQVHAELGLDYGRRLMTEFADWWDYLAKGIEISQVGDAAPLTLRLEAIGKELDSFPIKLISAATVNGVERAVSVVIDYKNEQNEVIYAAASCEGNMDLRKDAYVSGDLICNGDINDSVRHKNVNGDARAAGRINHDNAITGTVSPFQLKHVFPDGERFIRHFADIATVIPYRSRFRNVFLSPGYNPFGPENPLGIYMMDCGGKSFDIDDSIIVSTLILINVGGGEIEDDVYLRAYNYSYPALIIQTKSDYTINLDHGDWLYGAIYAVGNLRIEGDTRIYGPVIVDGNLSVSDDAMLFAFPSHLAESLEGFNMTGELEFQEGSRSPYISAD